MSGMLRVIENVKSGFGIGRVKAQGYPGGSAVACDDRNARRCFAARAYGGRRWRVALFLNDEPDLYSEADIRR